MFVTLKHIELLLSRKNTLRSNPSIQGPRTAGQGRKKVPVPREQFWAFEALWLCREGALQFSELPRG